MTHPVRKIANNNSRSGGEKNPPSGKIEDSHKLHVRKKIKKNDARGRVQPHRK
jgi:hypothetical protein